MNCQDEYEFIEAAQAKTLEEYAIEIDRIERAILAAQSAHSPEAEAIANERASNFYAAWGKEKIAAVYLQDAYDCYVRAGVTTKITELEQCYPQLLQSIQSPSIAATNYFTDEFIATLSHEFRNPLNGILGMSEALLEEVFGVMNERQLNAVTTIDRSGGYLLALVNNMTDLSQIQVGKLELELTQVSVVELCQFSASFVKHHAIQKQIQLDTHIPTDAGMIRVDLQRMRQVLINLLDRAIDATPIGGQVKLTVTRQPEGTIAGAKSSIHFAVSDTSKEIPVASEDELFQPILPSLPMQGYTNDSHHVGLGLMLVNPIVELHGGTLTCQSIIGQGTHIAVSLPHTCLVFEPQSEPSRSPDYLGTISETIVEEAIEPPLILIVEDNELNINTISSYLTVKGYRPIVAQDGESALKLAQKHCPDLILMDIQMPGMDGLEAISRIREHPQLTSIPIVALTALAMEGDRDKCLSAGANDYLTKPVKLKQLNQTIQQWLG
ncbi:response regulator [Chamaesiphon minutus]|uniref:histidine kinase n=1 Tax=Chamaesiphon minutus (strain ATCC 27169 / PCC 6605) TaxID=1173020 RepID=K9UB95_CHAP6|nr:response regulator [Chamaesiphon minutus]AFY91706.1 fused histidine kinase/response regulator receiver domain protein [Chamaesiphon minutus PCC 6605]